MIKISNHPNLIKNPDTGAILCNDHTLYEEHLKILTKKNEESFKIKKLEDSVQNLESSVKHITKLIEILINENNNKKL